MERLYWVRVSAQPSSRGAASGMADTCCLSTMESGLYWGRGGCSALQARGPGHSGMAASTLTKIEMESRTFRLPPVVRYSRCGPWSGLKALGHYLPNLPHQPYGTPSSRAFCTLHS